jgi:hypothetical protein
MALKFRYEKQEDVPKEHETLYKEVNGAWILEVEGVVPLERANELSSKVNEFRKTNGELTAKLAAFDGKKVLTEEEHKELIEAKEKLEKGHKPEELEALVEKRTANMRKAHASELASARAIAEEATTKHKKTFRELETTRVQATLAQVVSEVGTPAKGALQDINSRAAGVFRLNDDGNIVAMKDDGEEVMGTDGKPLTMKEFVTNLTKEAPYLFERSNGSGSKGPGDRSSRSSTRTISRGDSAGFGQNLEAIAKGEVSVDMEAD